MSTKMTQSKEVAHKGRDLCLGMRFLQDVSIGCECLKNGVDIFQAMK